MTILRTLLLALLPLLALACDVGCDTRMTYWRYKLINGKQEISGDATSLSAVNFGIIKDEVQAFDTLFVDLKTTQDQNGPDARLSWNADNGTYCVSWQHNFFHNQQLRYKCHQWFTRFEEKYGGFCESYNLLGECDGDKTEWVLVVNSGPMLRTSILSVVLFSLFFLLV